MFITRDSKYHKLEQEVKQLEEKLQHCNGNYLEKGYVESDIDVSGPTTEENQDKIHARELNQKFAQLKRKTS
jgi:hypothetical protein